MHFVKNLKNGKIDLPPEFRNGQRMNGFVLGKEPASQH